MEEILLKDQLSSRYKFINKIASLPFVDKILLYGSRARGDAHSRSDIDLAIECPKAMLAEWIMILDIVENADSLLNIDCVRFDNLKPENPLRISIERDKFILYTKEGIL
jgi:predicted nucleotidyltransferase